MRYASESSMTSPCSAQYPAIESSVSGSVCSLKGNCTLSFCVSLNRSNGTGSPAVTETPSLSRRYREPASAAVISLAFLRIRSSSCPTSRVSDRAIPTRFSSSRRSEEHTSELQSHHDLVCRLLLEKKKTD